MNLYTLAQTTPVSGSGLLDGLDNDQRFVLAIIGIVAVSVIVVTFGSVTAAAWSKIRSHQIETELKQDMLDRGMSADEIQKVIEATPQTGIDRWMGAWCRKR